MAVAKSISDNQVLYNGRKPEGRFMTAESPQDVTQLLVAWGNGDRSALNSLLPLIYAELHRLASHFMRGEAPGHILNTTALVNEAYLKLVNQANANWRNRAHFVAVSAQAMRQILIDVARTRNRIRRGGGQARHLSLDEVPVFTDERAAELIALDEALTSLAKLDERKSRIVEMRYFGGLSVEETAEVLKVSAATVDREWRRARAWLLSELGDGATDTVS
jgi:RNA polymerase sigma-70 factor (ECF subfamily)